MSGREWHFFDDKETPYKHWYERKDAKGRATRAQKDNPTKLLNVAMFENNRISHALKYQPQAMTLHEGNLDDASRVSAELIVGVIDSDIPLGHRAFRNADGTTRILYHWAMGQKTEGEEYGTYYSQSDINQLLRKYSPKGDLTKNLDADGFNREVGALDFGSIQGHRALGRRHSHGAHMLDTAGGCDPICDADFAKKVGLITVSMPSLWEFGEAGEFLELHMINAVDWLHKKTKKLRGGSKEESTGLPTVVSLAFGRQAGAKREDTDLFSRFLRSLKDEAENDPDTPRFELVIPTGNDNLNKVTARYLIGAGEKIDVDWRVLPADQTDNYLEVWVEQIENKAPPVKQLAIDLIGPISKRTPHPMYGQPGQYCDIDNDGESFASRIYRFAKPDQRDHQLTGYLIALGPTAPRANSIGAVQPGVWKVWLENTSKEPIVVHLSVQTDQSIQPVGQFSGRSYLDDPAYEHFDASGRQMDAVLWEDDQWKSTEAEVGTRRHGTLNVAASQNLTAVLGGYRASDGMPAIYASSGLGVTGRKEIEGPIAALPTDDTKVLGGTLSAGSTDGSRTAMRGTSFAASKATRVVAEEWLKNTSSRGKSANEILLSKADFFEATQQIYDARYDKNDPAHKAAFVKFGKGRIPFSLAKSAQALPTCRPQLECSRIMSNCYAISRA